MLAGEGVHHPTNRYSNDEEQGEGPCGILEALLWAAAPKSAKSEGNYQSEQSHGLEVGEQSGHGWLSLSSTCRFVGM